VNKKSKERKRSIIYLIQQFLKDEGYFETAESLKNEANISPNYCVCDNIDLHTLVQEFENYHYMKYQKYPKFCRVQNMMEVPYSEMHKTIKTSRAKSARPAAHQNKDEKQEICIGDIIGLDKAKELLKETIVYPNKYPRKTMLAKAVASESKYTFFNITASSVISKWRGESEKLIRVLFDLAQHHAPSCIFIDEFDSIVCRNKTEDHECSRRLRAELLVHLDGLHGLSKGNVFLLATTNTPWDLESSVLRRFDKRILVDLPTLEDRKALIAHLLPHTSKIEPNEPSVSCSIDYEYVAKISEGYTGSDLKAACKEAAMGAVRQAINILENDKNGARRGHVKKLRPITTQCVEDALRRCAPTTRGLSSRYHTWSNEFGSTLKLHHSYLSFMNLAILCQTTLRGQKIIDRKT
ncbi:hypothetical protein B566_EDAN000684, partial [Ephemera danica]